MVFLGPDIFLLFYVHDVVVILIVAIPAQQTTTVPHTHTKIREESFNLMLIALRLLNVIRMKTMYLCMYLRAKILFIANV